MRRVALVLGVLGAFWFAPGALAAGWCGSGEHAADLPDAVTARQVHAIVAVPSDAQDAFAAQANQVADDATSMVGWWAGQDPTRIPRFDEAVFGGSQCLDISYVRLPGTGASYAGAGADADFRTIWNQLVGAGFASIYKKYLVYFFGSTADAGVCGVGGGVLGTGPSFAVVIPVGCSDVPTDTTATHELLHALGAVPPGDPHCPADPGHPCDSPTDILYPYTGGEPLSAKVLDYNHDDYYGHSQSWPDVQDSLWLHRLDQPQFGLTLAFTGGSGTVKSELPGVDCTAACTTQWDAGALVTLDAEGTAGQDRFVRWSGACTGRTSCSVTLGQAATVSAVFGPLRIPVRVSALGRGRVVCTPRCGGTMTAGNGLRLTAVPAEGWKFTGWTGACRGSRAICTPPTDYAVAATARFAKKS